MLADRSSEYSIRLPTQADATELGALHVAVWRETYRTMMSDAALDALDPERSAERWRRIAADLGSTTNSDTDTGNTSGVDPDRVVQQVWIAQHTSTGTIAGFAWSGPARDDDAPTPGQLWALNVLAVHHGTGVANALLGAAIGNEPSYLWVVQENARARAFYRRHGFVEDGGLLHDDHLGADEVRMVRR